METTILQKDVLAVSQAVRSVVGYGVEELRTVSRTPARMMPAKSAICHYLWMRGHSHTVLAGVLGLSRPYVYYLLRRHGEMLFAEALYRRYVTELDGLLMN